MAMENDGTSKRTFWTDWWRKLFALIFALISFFLINGKIARDYTIENVKVEFNLIGQNAAIVLDEGITSKIVVNSTLPIGSIKADSYTVVVNIIPRHEDHKYRIKVYVDPQNVKKGLFLPSVKNVILSKDSIELDPIIQKSVPIIVNEAGAPRPGFTATKTLSPDTVTIEGPSEKLKNVKYIYSENLVLTPETTDFKCRLPLKLEDADVKFVNTDYVVIETKIVNINEMITKSYSDVPIRIMNEHPQVYAVEKMSSKTGRLEVRALKSILDSYLMESEIMLYIDLNEAKNSGPFRAKVYSGNLPPKDKVEIKCSPDYVDVVLYEVSKAQPEQKAVSQDEKDKQKEAPKAEGEK